MNVKWLILGVLGSLGCAALAQVSISAGGQDVQIGVDGEVSVRGAASDVTVGGADVAIGKGSYARSSVGEIAPNANIDGVTIINGKLWIDGKEIPPNVTRYKSPKTGKIYRIERNGKNISVTGTD